VGHVNSGTRPPTSKQPEIGGIRQASATARDETAANRHRRAFGIPAAIITLVRWLPIIWLGGVAISLFVLVRRAWAFHTYIRRAGYADSSLSRRVQQLAREAGLTAAPHVIAVRGAVSPMLWGAGGHVQLIFPTRLDQELSPLARDSLLLHELAHYRRGDQWVRLVELAAQVLYWWHPVVWWARREIEAAEEQCCDAWVVERQSGSRRSYAEALLATIDFLCEQPAMLPPAASGLGNVPLLRTRLTQIMCGDVAAGLPSGVKAAVLIVALVILPLGPALFGASVQPMRSPPATTIRKQPSAAMMDSIAAEAPASSEVHSSSLSAPSDTKTSVTAANLPAVVRPPVVVTATAVSRNGKYLLERRKGSHVTLVNQATDWRLDMSAHGILCVAFTPDSRLFITGHDDSLVRVWESETGGLAATLQGCTDAVWSVAVAASEAESYRIAAGAKDGSVLVWDLASREEVARLPPADVSVSCLRWSEQGDKLAISFGDFSDRDEGGLAIWSPLDNVLLWQRALDRPIAALAWLPGDDGLLVADWKGEAQLWQPGEESPRYSTLLGQGGKQTVEAANWSADCPLVPSWLANQMAARSE